jgi:hypothetical protein
MGAREAHLAYLSEKGPQLLRVAGPLLDEAGQMAGSLFIFEAPDRAAVEAFHADDPYRLSGLFESVDLLPWRQTVGEPI